MSFFFFFFFFYLTSSIATKALNNQNEIWLLDYPSVQQITFLLKV